MKNTIKIMAGLFLSVLSLAAFSQQTWDAKKNPTVDSIMSQYSAKYIAPRPALTTNDIFPVVGQFQSSSNPEAANVNITLDEKNQGIVWITGLPQGRLKAMLRKAPAFYKIPAQKTEEGKEVAEGTLAFDKETNTLNIIIGKPYNVEDPAAVFAVTAPEKTEATPKVTKSKSKNPVKLKTWSYTGTKLAVETVAN